MSRVRKGGKAANNQESQSFEHTGTGQQAIIEHTDTGQKTCTGELRGCVSRRKSLPAIALVHHRAFHPVQPSVARRHYEAQQPVDMRIAGAILTTVLFRVAGLDLDSRSGPK
jgi:hypothetical protein